jgi:hypothetical protein
MAGGVPAGRLSIEIVAEVARLTQDLQRVKGLVNAASGEIAKSARAANDNLAAIGKGAGAGVQQFSRDVAALKAQLDPAWASMQKYRQAVDVAKTALQQGAITHQQYVQALRQAADAAGLLKAKQAEAAVAANAEADALRKVNSQLAEQAQLHAAIQRNTGAGRGKATDAGAGYSALAAKFLEDEARAAQSAAAAQKRLADEHERLAAAVRNSHAAQVADAAAAERLREATDPLYAATKRLNAEIAESTRLYHAGATAPAEYARQQMVLNQSVKQVGTSLKLTARDGLNLSRQFSDIGVTAAMGMNPLMIAIQQGPQLLDIFQEKAIATGTTIGAVAKAAGAQIWAAVAPLLPILAAVAAAAALIGSAFALGAREINKGNKSVIDGMGLTEKQLERVKKAGTETGVTIGDTFFAFFEVVGDRLTSAFDGPLKWLKDAWDGTLNFITTYGSKAIELIVGGFVGGVYAIKAAWKILPAAIGDIVTSAANVTLSGIEWMINKTINGLNGLIDLANQAAAKVGMAGFDRLQNVQVGKIDNPYAGQADALGSAVSDGFSQGLSESKGMLNRFWADVAKESRNNARARIRKAAGEAEKARKGPKTEAEKFADLVADVQRQIAMLEAQRKALALSDDAALLLTNQQKLLNDAQAKGIHITEQQHAVLMALADQLTEAQIALRKAQNLKAANEGYATQVRAIEQAGEQIGVYGKELTALTAYQELLNKATNGGKDALDDLTDARLRGKAATIADKQAANDNRKFMEDLIVNTEAMQRAMEAERGGLGLTGAALHAYRFEQEALEKARQDHIDLTPAQIDAIKATGAAFGEMRQEIDNAASRLDALASALGNMKGLGPLGQLMGILTSGDPTAALLGSGGLGTLAGIFTKGGQDAYKKQAEIISDGLKSVFPELGDTLAGTLSGALQGVGIGGAVGGVLGGGKTSQLGSQLGGAIGQAVGTKLLSSLGAAAGPVGAIGGALLGAVAGDLMKGILNPNRSASANITGINNTSVSGKDRAQYGAANDLAGSVTSGLKQIADAFGATVGAFQVAIGVRGDQIKVNTSGSSLKTGAGAKGFGEDAEAAARYAILDAIKDGALSGMREGAKRLLESGKDLDAALQDALAFNSVFDQLEQLKDPTGFALKQLDKELTELRDNFARAGASAAEYAQLEELYGIKRAEVSEQTKDATDALELERTRRGMEAELLRLSGDEIAATAIARQLEREQLEPSLQALYDQIAAKQDEIAANEKLTAAQEEAKAVADAAAQAAVEIQKARTSLQIELLEAQGKAEEALALTRQQQLADMDPLLRGLQQQIWAAQEATKAQQGLAEAQKAAADAADAAREAQQAAANGLVSLRERLLQAQGNDAGLRELQRALEWEKASAAEREAMEQIYKAEDAARKAADAAAARAARQQAAEEAAAKAAQLRESRTRLEIQLMEALGDKTGALKKQRELELAGMDASLRGLQQQVWAAQEAAAAAEKWRDLGKSLREYRNELTAGDLATANAYRNAQVAFMTTSALARAGDEAAIGKLQGVSQSFLDASRSNAGSLEQYQRDLAAVLRSVDDTLDYTDGQIDTAQAQLDAISKGNNIQTEVRDQIAGLRAENKAAQTAMAIALDRIRVLNEGEDGDGVLRVKVEA